MLPSVVEAAESSSHGAKEAKKGSRYNSARALPLIVKSSASDCLACHNKGIQKVEPGLRSTTPSLCGRLFSIRENEVEVSRRWHAAQQQRARRPDPAGRRRDLCRGNVVELRSLAQVRV